MTLSERLKWIPEPDQDEMGTTDYYNECPRYLGRLYFQAGKMDEELANLLIDAANGDRDMLAIFNRIKENHPQTKAKFEEHDVTGAMDHRAVSLGGMALEEHYDER